MGRPATRRSVSRRGRSKSPEKKASPAKTRSRTRSTRKSTKKESPKADKSKSATTVKPLKLDSKTSPSKKKTAKGSAKPAAIKFELDTLWVCRIHYMQLFCIGVCAIGLSDFIGAHCFAKSIQGPGFDLAMKWFGVALIAFSMQHMAAAQGTPAERKKSLQYGMVFWMMASALLISSNELLKKKEFSIYGSAWVLANMTLAIYSCYYHVEAK